MIAVSSEALRREFRRLARGRGASSPHLASELGPELRRLCDISSADGPTSIKSKLQSRLTAVVQHWADDHREAVMVALGLRVDDPPSLMKRTNQFARDLGMSERTAMRRIDRALQSLARDLVAREAAARLPELSYVVDEFRALVRLDMATLEVMEERRIIATRDHVGSARTAVGLPRGVEDVDVQVLFGGRLVASDVRPSGLLRHEIEFPYPLAQGERYTYTVRLRMPVTQPIAPHYVVQPATSLEAFELRVQFDPSVEPRQVWRVEGALHREIDDREASPELLQLDRAGDVQATFHNVHVGLAYGVAWSWSADEDAGTGSGLESH